MMIRICLAVMLLTGNASWLVAQQMLRSANLAAPQWEVPIPLAWDDDNLASYGHHALLNSERGCRLLRNDHNTSFMLQYEWKLNREETGIKNTPCNRETWTEFATVLKPKLPTGIKRITMSESQSGFSGYRLRGFTSLDRVQNLWNAVLVSRHPFQQPNEYSVRYKVTREPDSLYPHYEGTINSYPVITARAKTIEALEAKLLEMYCDYITQMVEEDTLQAVNNAKANNPLERVPPGWCDIPAVQFGY